MMLNLKEAGADSEAGPSTTPALNTSVLHRSEPLPMAFGSTFDNVRSRRSGQFVTVTTSNAVAIQ
jgi:hypothetical protein